MGAVAFPKGAGKLRAFSQASGDSCVVPQSVGGRVVHVGATKEVGPGLCFRVRIAAVRFRGYQLLLQRARLRGAMLQVPFRYGERAAS